MTTATGEQRRNTGTSLAAAKRPSKTLALRIAILERVIRGEAITIDDVLPPDGEEKRTNHVGSAVLSLSTRKLIRQTGERRRSQRDFRHAGTNPVWVAIDVAKCQVELKRLTAELEKIEPPARQGSLFGTEGGLSS